MLYCHPLKILKESYISSTKAYPPTVFFSMPQYKTDLPPFKPFGEVNNQRRFPDIPKGGFLVIE